MPREEDEGREKEAEMMQTIARLVKWIGPFVTLLLIATATVSAQQLLTGLGSRKLQLAYEAPTRLDKPLFGGDMTYHGGLVIDGVARVYLIFWIDPSFQRPSARYVNLLEQFVTDLGQSSLYGMLSQYPDARGHHPTGTRLAGTFIDQRPFSPAMVATRESFGTFAPIESFITATWAQEVQQVTASQNWDNQSYHNLFVLLPVMNWGCGWHSYLTDEMTGHAGSPYAVIPYPSYQGREQCADSSQSPNGDHVSDIAIDSLSHELLEAVTSPYLDGWYTNKDDDAEEMADKCQFISAASIDPSTKGNVTWNGHSYAIQEEYDNRRHGCVLAGP